MKARETKFQTTHTPDHVVDANKKVATRPPSHVFGQMNKGERLYSDFLSIRMRAGEIKSFAFETDTLLLAHLCRYTPDFKVVLPDGRIEYHECKGKKGKSYYAHEDARIKIKVAATLYPHYTFCVVWLDKGTWKRKDVPRVQLPLLGLDSNKENNQ